MQIRDYLDDTRDQLKWKWSKGDATSVPDFKDPANGSASYHVCVYDASANPQPRLDSDVPPSGTCTGRPCWKASSTGFVYRNKTGAGADGITSMKLRAGSAGRARIQVKGRGAALQSPALPLTIPVTVQFVAQDGLSTECWQTTFSAFTKNESSRFSAKGP